MVKDYNELTIGRWESIQAVAKDETLEELERQVRILSVLSGMSDEEIMHLPIAEYKQMVIDSRFLESQYSGRCNIAKEYNIGGFCLVPVTDFRKVEMCQYYDFQTYAPDIDSRFPELISCLVVPKGKRYNEGYDIVEVHKAIRENMPVADGLALSAFFLTLCEQSTRDMVNCCMPATKMIPDKKERKRIRKVLRMLRKGSWINGDGSPMLMR